MGANGIETMPLIVTGQGEYSNAPAVDDAAPRSERPERDLRSGYIAASVERALCELLQAIHGGRVNHA